jgi:hypothetical protein
MEKFPPGPKHDRNQELDSTKRTESVEREPKAKVLSVGYDDEYHTHSRDNLFQVTQDFDLEKARKQFADERQAKIDFFHDHLKKDGEAGSKGDYGYRDRNPDFAEMDSDEIYKDDSETFTKWLIDKGMGRKVDITEWDGLDVKDGKTSFDRDEYDKFVESKSHKTFEEWLEAKETDNGKRPKMRILSMGYDDEYASYRHSPDYLVQVPRDFDFKKTHEQFKIEGDENLESDIRDGIESFHKWLIEKGLAKELDIVEWDG